MHLHYSDLSLQVYVSPNVKIKITSLTGLVVNISNGSIKSIYLLMCCMNKLLKTILIGQ